MEQNLQEMGRKQRMAERVGFEPTIPVKVYTLSKRAPSATRPSLRKKLRGSSHCTAVLQCRLLAEGMFASRPEPVNLPNLSQWPQHAPISARLWVRQIS